MRPKTRPDSKATDTESAYLAWIGHTFACATCRVGVACLTALRLGRAWRQGRA